MEQEDIGCHVLWDKKVVLITVIQMIEWKEFERKTKNFIQLEQSRKSWRHIQYALNCRTLK